MKKQMKKIAVGVMMLSMLFGSTAAFAENTVDPDNGSSVDVVGTTDSTIIIVTVPTALSFAINPNSETPFISVPATIINGTYAPVDFQVLGIISDSGTSTKVVEQMLHTDKEWQGLGKSATTSQIALGIKEASKETVIWSPAEVPNVTPSTVAGTIKLDPDSTKEISVSAKHGNAWSNAQILNFKAHIRVELTQE
ncbi:hypothetical protein [Paenibacillus piri]|uniref:WxL domain-containing protein n=1 Tax=Paenibacillus piri TaxID=2547395 RepID=A0A4R5L0K1_9BACL|nr:hypothetical protein [Paenibacillus piri]TDG00881.1 hypothetical protein E1757_04525 [Paenibacillus piri]